MRYVLLFFLPFAAGLASAQDLAFNKLVTESENRWVAFPPRNDTSGYSFGFVYIDSMAGLTLQFTGTFKSVNGRYVPSYPFKDQSVKMRMSQSRAQVAWIDPARFSELDVPAVPDWLKYYEGNPNATAHLWRWGYLYNEYEQPRIALGFLRRALAQDSAFKGLAEEAAFSYNALQEYDSAIVLLAHYPPAQRNCYVSKELAFAYEHKHDLAGSARVYHEAEANCKDPQFLAEMAYNLTVTYYEQKDKKGFATWAAELRRWLGAASDDRFGKNLRVMETRLAQ